MVMYFNPIKLLMPARSRASASAPVKAVHT